MVTAVIKLVSVGTLPQPSDYQPMFRMLKRSGCLINEFLLAGPLGPGEPLIINHEGAWSFLLPKRSFERLGRRGVELLGNAEQFTDYATQFAAYITHAADELVPRWSGGFAGASSQELLEAVQAMGRLWRYYGYTESVFQDAAVRELERSGASILKRNLASLDALKFQGRQIFNAYIMKGGLFDSLMDQIDQTYFGSEDTARYLYFGELREVMVDNGADMSDIASRRACYAVAMTGGMMRKFEYEEAVRIWESFETYEREQIEAARAGLRGAVANKGVARGRVVIAPMLNLAEAQKVAERMQPGDILLVQSTNPDLMMLCRKAAAIVTNQGGVLSHAAIISRELNIPCIVGTVNATRVFQDGDVVEVDANNGVVRQLTED